MRILLCVAALLTYNGATPLSPDLVTANDTSWDQLRISRQEEIDEYLAEHGTEYSWFANAAHGINTGLPVILLRILPELAPDIWGTAQERYSRFGFVPDPTDAQRPLPMGLGWTQNPVTSDSPPATIHLATLTCAACHVGRVRAEDKSVRLLIGAPSTEIDVRKYRNAIEQTAEELLSDNARLETTKRIRILVEEKPKGYFFAGYFGIDETVEEIERKIFLAKLDDILRSTYQGIEMSRKSTQKQLMTNYSAANAPPLVGGTPGQSDGSGDLLPKLLLAKAASQGQLATYLSTNYAELPEKKATATDNMSVWMQKDRAAGQLDGSVRNPFMRNIAAEVAVAGRSAGVNAPNAAACVKLTHALPPPPYPFHVDMARAKRGELLFEQHCAECHAPLNSTVYKKDKVSTDQNRAQVLNEEGLALFLQAFRDAIPDDFPIDVDGERLTKDKIRDDQLISARVLPSEQGYVANPLDGIWARAPYLHNGSVPTLRHLLQPATRPPQFLRGSIDYDTDNVGFAWEAGRLEEASKTSPTVAIFDTGWDGACNKGHDKDVLSGSRILRLNWSDPTLNGQLTELLEYLKTL